MDGIMKGVGGNGGGGGGRVGIVEEDMSDGMQCSFHPYRNNPGGVCAFCLQDKLGKLVSSSFPLPIRASSSSTSSSSPSVRSDIGSVGAGNGVGSASAGSLSLAARPTTTKGSNDGGHDTQCQDYHTRRSKLPFLLVKTKTKIVGASSSDRDIVFKRSKTTTTPGRTNRHRHFLVTSTDDGDEDNISPRRRGGFWSFLYLSSSSSAKSITAATHKTTEKASSLTVTTSSAATTTTTTTTNGSLMNQKKCLGTSTSKKLDIVVAEEDGSPNSQATGSASSFERKVSRSRSVGCGSRSFSGDFFERISTGFGDCTLRRVESQREGKPKGTRSTSNMKERVKCGGIFSGFMITSSTSSSSYWVSSSAENHHVNEKLTHGVSAAAGPLANGRSRSWSWALASPMRAFSKPSSKDGKGDIARPTSNNTTTPNLSAIPSLLAVRG